MPSWGAVAWGVIASAIVAAVALRFALRERRLEVIVVGAVSALLGPLLWDMILRHTGGRFLVDAPGYIFPVSYEDTISGVFAGAIAALLLGFGPQRGASGRRLALDVLTCGLAALLVDTYLY